MSSQENPLMLLVEHEEAISKLYNAYAVKFPDHEEFWATLAWEELDHAERIRQLAQYIEQGHVRFDAEKFKPIVIKTSMEYVAKELASAESKDVSMKKALAVALNIEKAIIDGQVFEAFKGHTAEARDFIRECEKNFEEHYRVVQEMWSTHRSFS